MYAFIDFTPEDRPDEPTVLSQRTHTARTFHTCDICDGFIFPGDAYTKTVIIDDGDFGEYKEHIRCPDAPVLLIRSGR